MRPTEKTGNKQVIRVNGLGINIQKLRWVGYSVTLDGCGNTIPDHLVVNVDFLDSNQIHVGSPSEFDSDGHETGRYPHTTGLPLPLSNQLQTLQTGLAGIEFEINRRIHRDIAVEVLRFDDSGKLIPMETKQADKATKPILQHLVLFFSYDFVSYF